MMHMMVVGQDGDDDDDDDDGDGDGGNANANANDGGARYFDAQQEGSGPSRLCNNKKKVTIRKAMMIMRKMVTAMISMNIRVNLMNMKATSKADRKNVPDKKKE